MALPFDGVVFDLDGTLIDSVPDVRNALNAMLARFDRAALSAEQVRTMVGEGARVMLERAFAVTGTPCDDLSAALDCYLEAYCAHPVVDTVVYPGALEAMRALAGDGVRLGICTNKPERVTRLVLDALNLAPLLAATVGGDSLPFRKPDGRHILETVARMGDVRRPIMVGDSETDVAAAKNAGIPVVAVGFGYDGDGVRRLGADAVIDHFDELIPKLTRWGT